MLYQNQVQQEQHLLQPKFTARKLVKDIAVKCKNPCKMINFGHAAVLASRYSTEIIQVAIEEFPNEYKGLYPIRYLEGIIKQAILKNKDINSAVPENIANVNRIRSIIKDLFKEGENS